MALYPLMTAIGLNLLASLVVTFPSRGRQVRQEVAKESAWRTFFTEARRKMYVAWFALAPLGASILVWAAPPGIRWVLLLFVMIPWIKWLAELPLVVQFIPSPHRGKAVYWLVALPVLAIQLGADHAQAYFDGNETRTVAPVGAAKDLLWDKDHPIGYLGFAGGTYFLFESKTGNVVMVNQAVSGPLTLQPRPVTTLRDWIRGFQQHEA